MPINREAWGKSKSFKLNILILNRLIGIIPFDGTFYIAYLLRLIFEGRFLFV